MPFTALRVLALIAFCVSAALITIQVTLGGAEPAAPVQYVSDDETRLAALLDPVFGAKNYRFALNEPDSTQLSMMIDSAAFPEGTLPISEAKLSEILDGVLISHAAPISLQIHYIPFADTAASGFPKTMIELVLSGLLSLVCLALYWGLPRSSQRPNELSAGLPRDTARPPETMPEMLSVGPAPERAAQIIRAWMHEAKPS